MAYIVCHLFKRFVNNYWSFEKIDHASTDACYLVNFMEVVECKILKINLTVSEFSKAKNSSSASWFSNVWIRFNNLRVDKCYRIKVGKYVCYTLWGMREEKIIMLLTKNVIPQCIHFFITFLKFSLNKKNVKCLWRKWCKSF